jgi:hypothetical protein
VRDKKNKMNGDNNTTEETPPDTFIAQIKELTELHHSGDNLEIEVDDNGNVTVRAQEKTLTLTSPITIEGYNNGPALTLTITPGGDVTVTGLDPLSQTIGNLETIEKDLEEKKTTAEETEKKLREEEERKRQEEEERKRQEEEQKRQEEEQKRKEEEERIREEEQKRQEEERRTEEEKIEKKGIKEVEEEEEGEEAEAEEERDVEGGEETEEEEVKEEEVKGEEEEKEPKEEEEVKEEEEKEEEVKGEEEEKEPKEEEEVKEEEEKEEEEKGEEEGKEPKEEGEDGKEPKEEEGKEEEERKRKEDEDGTYFGGSNEFDDDNKSTDEETAIGQRDLTTKIMKKLRDLKNLYKEIAEDSDSGKNAERYVKIFYIQNELVDDLGNEEKRRNIADNLEKLESKGVRREDRVRLATALEEMPAGSFDSDSPVGHGKMYNHLTHMAMCWARAEYNTKYLSNSSREKEEEGEEREKEEEGDLSEKKEERGELDREKEKEEGEGEEREVFESKNNGGSGDGSEEGIKEIEEPLIKENEGVDDEKNAWGKRSNGTPKGGDEQEKKDDEQEKNDGEEEKKDGEEKKESRALDFDSAFTAHIADAEPNMSDALENEMKKRDAKEVVAPDFTKDNSLCRMLAEAEVSRFTALRTKEVAEAANKTADDRGESESAETKKTAVHAVDATRGVGWDKFSDSYKKAVKNYDNSISFQHFKDETRSNERILTFKKNDVTLTLTFNDGKGEKFDILRMSEHLGKNVGLVGGLLEYIEADPDCGIGLADLSAMMAIKTKKANKISDDNKKLEILLANFGIENSEGKQTGELLTEEHKTLFRKSFGYDNGKDRQFDTLMGNAKGLVKNKAMCF